MENIPVLSNRLDESNGTVEHVLEMKAKKTPWHLRFAPKAKGIIVSFVQNLLSPLTQKEGVRGGQLSAFFQSAAAAVVGIGLLVGSTGDVQAACDPPVYDVCFHKNYGDFSTAGTVELIVEFDVPYVKRNQQYEIVWNGYKLHRDYNDEGREIYHYDGVSQFPIYGNTRLSYDQFWWDPNISWNNYGLSIYEGETVNGKWVRGKWVAQVDFYAYQHASYVSIDNSSDGLDFELSTYYCSVDWHPVPTPLYSGYTRRTCWLSPWGVWYRWGDVGSPRFAYRSRCSHTITPTPCP